MREVLQRRLFCSSIETTVSVIWLRKATLERDSGEKVNGLHEMSFSWRGRAIQKTLYRCWLSRQWHVQKTHSKLDLKAPFCRHDTPPFTLQFHVGLWLSLHKNLALFESTARTEQKVSVFTLRSNGECVLKSYQLRDSDGLPSVMNFFFFASACEMMATRLS